MSSYPMMALFCCWLFAQMSARRRSEFQTFSRPGVSRNVSTTPPPDLIQTTRQNAIAYSAHRSAGSAIAKISKRGGGVAIGADGRNRFACIPVGDVAAHVFRIEREVLASA